MTDVIAAAPPGLPADTLPPDGHPPEPRRQAEARHRALGAGALLLTTCGIIAPDPVCLLAGVVTAGTLALRRWLPTDVALPASAVGTVLLAVLLGLAADAAQVDALSAPAALAALWALVVGACVIWSWRGPLTHGLPVPGRLFVLAQLPAAAAGAVAVLQQIDLSHVAAWMFFGTDFTEHAVLLEQVQSSGALDYGENAYPRGAHALLALLSVPGLPEGGTAALLSYDLRFLGAATWLAFGLLLWTMSALALHAGKALGLPPAWSVAAALGLGGLIHFDSAFTLVFVVMASAPGLLAAVTACLVPLVAWSRDIAQPLLWTAIAVICASVTMAHLWPALIPVPVIAGTVSLIRRGLLRRVILSARGPRSYHLALCLACLALLAVVAVLPVLALLRGSGLATAAVEGRIPAPPLAHTAVGLVGLLLLWRRDRSARASAGAAVGAGLTVAVLLVGAGGGFDLGQYYPSKAMWFLAVLVLPSAAVTAAVACRKIARATAAALSVLGPAARVARVAVVAVVVAVAAGFGLPVLLGQGSLAEVAAGPAGPTNDRRIAIALDHGHRHAPAVTVPIALGLGSIPRDTDTYVLSKLLGFKTGQPQTHGHPDEACVALSLVAGEAPAVVITDLDPEVLSELMRRQGCAPTRIEQIPGGNPGVLHLFRQQVSSAARS